MYNIRKLPQSQDPPTTGPITNFETTKFHSREKNNSIKYSLTTSQPLAKAYKGKKKKLNFTKARNDEKKIVRETEIVRNDAEELRSNDTITDSRSSDNYLQSLTNPHIVIVGVVKRSDVPLTYLCPASVCSCSGLYVPRETRHKHIHTHFHQYGDVSSNVHSTVENKPPLEASGSCVSINTSLSSPPPSTRSCVCKTPEMSTCTRHFVSDFAKSPSTAMLNLSPQIHLTKHPFTPPSRLSIRRALNSSRRRSKSAPLARSLHSAIAQCLNGSVTVDVHRCIPPLTEKLRTKSDQNTNSRLFHSPRMRSRGKRLQRSISMSPRYPVIRLKNVLSDNPQSCRGDNTKV